MKKNVFGKKLSRERDSRRALFRGLTISLIENGKIETTQAKAKAVLPEIDRIVNLGKDGSTASLRRVYSILGGNSKAVKKLSLVAPKFTDRKSGFTRIVKIGARRGDRAPMVRLEWVENIETIEKKKVVNKKESKVKTKDKKEKAVATKKELKKKK
jgi:large subunit ribosomal protein L17